MVQEDPPPPARNWPKVKPKWNRVLIRGHIRFLRLRPHPPRPRLHLPGLLPGRLAIHLPGAPQVHIERLAALAPGGHPVAVGLGALAALLDQLPLPDGQVLQPGLELEGPGLCQCRICLALQPVPLGRAAGARAAAFCRARASRASALVEN